MELECLMYVRLFLELEYENRESAAVDEIAKSDGDVPTITEDALDISKKKEHTPCEEDFETIKLISNGAYA